MNRERNYASSSWISIKGKGTFSIVAACVLLLVSLYTASTFAEDESVLLRFDPPVGKTLVYHASSSTQITIYGMETFINESMDYEVFFPDTTSEEGRIAEVTFKKVSGSVMRGENTMDYNPPLKLEGKKITIIVSPKGEVLKAIPHGYIEGMKSLDQIRNVVANLFPNVPDSTIQVGAKWGEKKEGNSESAKNLISMEYKLKQIKESHGIKIAEIEGKVKMSGTYMSQNGKVEGGGEGKIKEKLAVEGCYLVECKYQIDIKGTAVGGAAGGGKSSEVIMSEYFRCKLKK